MHISFWQFFTDPVLRAPTLGCMLMAFSAALVGVIAFVRRRSLLGESLSHAAYPGVILAVAIGSAIFPEDDFWIAPMVLCGAFITALLGLSVMEFLERRFRVRQDSALCFVLAGFFGIGITFASRLQFTHAVAYRQIQMYLYGQAATMTDVHILIYGCLTVLIMCVVASFYKELKTSCFDRPFARSLGMNLAFIDLLVFLLIVLAVIIGIRSVGVVLMSAMLVAAPAAARQYTNRLSHLFLLAGFFGLLSGFLGNYLSVILSMHLEANNPDWHVSLPTGPMIVLVSVSLCVFSLLFAPQRGLLLRLIRVALFRDRCLQENLLKAMWRFEQNANISLDMLNETQTVSRRYLAFVMRRLALQGWLVRTPNGHFCLTADGQYRAARIIRLHRLWEVYLVEYLGVGAERVHLNAEEMEHVLTPELELKLTELLRDPKQDPHAQPIPPGEVVL